MLIITASSLMVSKKELYLNNYLKLICQITICTLGDCCHNCFQSPSSVTQNASRWASHHCSAVLTLSCFLHFTTVTFCGTLAVQLEYRLFYSNNNNTLKPPVYNTLLKTQTEEYCANKMPWLIKVQHFTFWSHHKKVCKGLHTAGCSDNNIGEVQTHQPY